MQRLPDVVKNLLIINVLMFVAFQVLQILPPRSLAMFYPSDAGYFKPYQLVTHMFMHASPPHLLFNMMGLYFFGPPLEYYLGPKRFLSYYLITAFGALLLHLCVNYVEINYLGFPPEVMFKTAIMGASGAIFGLLAGFAMKFPNQRIMLLFPPIPMKARTFVLVYAAIELFLGIGRFNTGIAHFAHLGGALFGFLLITYWDKRPNSFRR